MDDILSAALGQSGLNLSFLEEQQDESSSTNGHVNNTQTTSVETHSQFCVEQVQQSVKEDVEDVTELLNLLEDDSSNATDSILNTNKDSKRTDDGEVDMLDFLLKYQSDEDETDESVGSPVISVNIVTTVKTPQITSLKNTQVQRNDTDLDIKKHLNISSKFPKITTTSTILSSNKLSSRPPSTRVVIPSVAMLNNKLSVLKTNKVNAGKIQVAQSSMPNPIFSDKKNKTNNIDQTSKSAKQISDEEKRKLSIQHVLASPNLTYREKQFLMKSALSANIKPSHPTISSTLKYDFF